MPKVELSLNQGGILANSKLDHRNRKTRDLSNPEIHSDAGHNRMRVVKKLIRVQLVTNDPNSNNLETNTEPINIETTTKRRRRRLKIKKKKRKLQIIDNIKNISLFDEDHLQQATKPRKRIIVTRKRLLPSDKFSTDLEDIKTFSPIASTRVNEYQNSIDYTRYNHIVHDYEDSSQENEINDELDDFDKSDETLFDKPNTEDDLTILTNVELVTLKESDFFTSNDEDDYQDVTVNTEEVITPVNISFNDETYENATENVTEAGEDYTSETAKDVTTMTSSDITTEIVENVTNETVPNVTTETVKNVTVENPNQVTTESPANVTSETLITIDIPVDFTTETSREEYEDTKAKPIFQDIPDYEPYFPELTESLDAPIILLKTTILSSIEQLTKTVVQSRLRTYTFVVTRVAGTEQIVTSTTEVKPHTKTIVVTEPVTRLTTLTLLDLDATKTLTNPKSSITSALDKSLSEDNQLRNYEEARNLATRVMSNGVEVIVAGDKTIPGDKDFKRLLTSGSYKPVTLKASTLTDHMVMLMPQESSEIDSLSSSIYPNQFITKTCLTTFTYLTTFLEGSTTTVSSHEQVISNIATEERNTGKILPTPAMGVTLTQHPKLSVGVFHTTYTYLNTILDGDQPLVVSSKHTVTNTVTAPDDYLSLLKTSGTLTPVKDTNTYFSTIGLEKTLYEGNKTSVTSTKEVVTQVVITESVPPRATSVMTSYIALDVNDNPDAAYITTDVVKTYFVTYTYFNTVTKNNKPVVNSNISVSTDIVTEKLYIIPKTSMKIDMQSKEQRLGNNFQIFTTKSYLTTFTYFTTLLQEEDKETPTVVNSRTSVIENLISETVDLSLLDRSNLNQIRNAIEKGSKSVVKTITLYNGETFEITAIANEVKETITPTKVLPIEKTQMVESLIRDDKISEDSSTPNVITGSTIVFIDDDPFAQLTATPVLNRKSTEIKNNVNSITVSDKSTKVSKTKRSTKSKTKTHASSINPSKTKKTNVETVKSKPQSLNNDKIKDKKNSLAEKAVVKPSAPSADLLGLGSLNIKAIAPVLNAMAGLISTNLKTNRRSDVNVTTTAKPIEDANPPEDIQSRSPIYIPVRGLDDDFEIAESQNIATFEWVDPPPNKPLTEISSHESSLISNGIPISPGDIITTNSDVIVGKPGRIGPRIPSIPLHQVTQENEIPVGMKPPPLANDWGKKNHEYKHIPVVDSFDKSHYVQNDYIGPPPQLQGSSFNANENINEIRDHTPVYAKNQKNYIPNRHQYPPNNQNYLVFKENLQPAFTNNNPVYAQDYNHNHDISKLRNEMFINEKQNINEIKSSIIHKDPLILPEVIERSTGQPLLVNIQPSQVALVNIPFNRTTALIFGGSTEPHRNGQYFDDPAPYPQPDLSGVEINNNFPQITSLYQPQLPNQKQVNGVIQVDNQLINNDPVTSENQKIQFNIQPTRINSYKLANQQNNVNFPPVSYGMVHQGSDFNAHVINHNDMTRPGNNIELNRPIDFQRRPLNNINSVNTNNIHYQKDTNYNYRKPSHMYPGPVYHDQKMVTNKRIPDNILANSQINNKPYNFQKHASNKKNILRPNSYTTPIPNLEISEFMSPPSTPRIYTKRPYNQKQNKRPILIPVPPPIQSVTPSVEQPQTPVNFRPSFPIYEVHVPAIPGKNPNNNPYRTIPTQKYPDFTFASEIGDHKEDDMENEDGEVIQESNSRPLLPGEIPSEIIQATSTTERTIEHIRVSNPAIMEATKPLYASNNDFKFSTQPQRPLITDTYQKGTYFSNNTGLSNQHFSEIINGKITFGNEGNQGISNTNQDRNVEQSNRKDLDKINMFGIGTHEIVSINENLANQKPILIFIDDKQESKKEFFNKNKELNNRERPAVTSLPISSFKENNNRESDIKYKEFKTKERATSKPQHKQTIKNISNRPRVTSLPINTFKEHNIRDRIVTPIPIENFKFNRERSTSLPTNIFKYDGERPVTSLPINAFKHNMDRPVTSQPLITFKEHTNRDRPAVTSLPINKFKEFNDRERPAVTSIASDKDLQFNNVHKFGTQTEKPFSGVPSKTISSNEIIRKDIALPRPLPPDTDFSIPPENIDKVSNLNTGEVPVLYENRSEIISDMEIMKPPPLLSEKPARVPDNSIQSHSQKPNVYTVLPAGDDLISTLPNLSEEMVPPPKSEENVLGMLPPPWSSSKIPSKVTTPRYSMEIDVSTEKSTQKTPEVHNIRTKRPFTRRPGYRTTTSHIPITTSRRRPVYPHFNAGSSTTESTKSTSPTVIISPTPSIKVKHPLEVITGHPDGKIQNHQSTTVDLSFSEVPITTQNSYTEPDLLEIKNLPNNKSLSTVELNSSSNILLAGVHHAGNEIKVVLETTKPLPNTIKSTYNETKSRVTIPTRYITHTKTATVTITKTTVIKSLGMTPSTLTILVTKTEKTTIVDTVTEVHTLVKPTSIIETVTTTIQPASSLYPDELYGTHYPPIQVKPSITDPFFNYNDTVVDSSEDNENLEDFIIHDTDPPITKGKENDQQKDVLEDNDTILVIMTDKNTKNIVKVPSTYETQERDEIISTNKDNNVLLGGILSANHPEDKEEKVLDRCEPECKAARNELCQKLDGLLRCTCRPGFARMFPDRPCLPTYMYDLKITLDRIGKDSLHFYDDLSNPNSTEHFKFKQAISEALDRMVMQSDLRDIFHGVKVHHFEPGTKGIVSKFYLQLSENMDEKRLEEILKNYLSNNSFSLGGTDIYSSPLMDLEAKDFDECTQPHLHDCSENAQCFNLKGTYSCSCKEGFSDLSENMLYPGRICSAEQIGCEKCNYHGTCYSRGPDEVLCECFQWYTGQYCHINLKVLLIALVTLGTLLFGLLLTCIILTCIKGKPRSLGVTGGINFLPQGNVGRRNALDRRAMIQDTSSEEDNKSETSRYVKKPKPSSKRTSKVSMQASERGEASNLAISFDDQKDRSLTVMIPRAKYHPAPPTSPLINYTSFDVHKPSVPSTSNEAKLLSFLDAGPSPNKSEPTRKFSNAQSESIIEEKSNSRKTSGALISAGFEVSATVVNNMGTLGTTCGTEADRSENATLIQKISADLLSSTGTRSQFNTLRKSLVDEDLESNVNGNASNWLDMLPRVMTVSEARSYDETTIPPPMKCLRPDYDSKPSSHHHNDEANTMAERDLGSTFLLPHTHLYKPDRGSDISGFESL